MIMRAAHHGRLIRVTLQLFVLDLRISLGLTSRRFLDTTALSIWPCGVSARERLRSSRLKSADRFPVEGVELHVSQMPGD